MPPRKKSSSGTATKVQSASLADDVESALSSLQKMSTKRDRENLARFGIVANNALGVSMSNMKKLAKRLGRNHELALALWDTDAYEARMLATLVDEPARVSPAQMDRWCKDFDNWAICDTACFALFDRTPHAWDKTLHNGRAGATNLAGGAAFALLWGLTVHDKDASDGPFLHGLVLVERAANDERHFVKKAVNMALRAVGKRNPSLHAAAVALARDLAGSSQPAARWVGSDALRELTGSSVTRRLAAAKTKGVRK